MGDPADISSTIVETLYADALRLADEARAAFDMSGRLDLVGSSEELARVALSCEALRTTTRMMHVLAWLLNHRAYFAGELSEFCGRAERVSVAPPRPPATRPARTGCRTVGHAAPAPARPGDPHPPVL